MALILCSFADRRLWRSKNRLLRQSSQMNVYDNIYFFDETDIAPDFLVKHREILNTSVRGFGYWIWKPYFISKVLSLCNDGDIIHYIDVGCWLNHRGKDRFYDYIEMVNKSQIGLLAFKNMYYGQFKNLNSYSLPERQWTKSDTLDYFGVLHDSDIINSEQVLATTFFVKKSPLMMDFVDNWLSAWDDYRLVNDDVSLIPNSSDFVEHRHDQSVFSILCKQLDVDTVSYFEIFYPDLSSVPSGKPIWKAKPNWSEIECMPILAKRDKEYGIINKLVAKASYYINKVSR